MLCMDDHANKTGNKSIILGSVSALGSKVRGAVANSAIGSFFSSYDRANDTFEKSVAYGAAKKMLKSRKIEKVRRTCSAMFDNSLVRRSVLSLTKTLRHCTMRFWGVFLLSFSMYVVLMYLIRKYGMFYTAPVSYLAVSAVVSLLSLPLLADKNTSLGSALLDSKLFSWLLFDFFELRYENFRDTDAPIVRTSVAFISGMILGCMSFFISPLTMILTFIFLLYLYLAVVSPESAFLLCLFFVPFLSVFEHPTVLLCVLVICVLLGYVIKLFRHKRTFRFGILEGTLVLFMLTVLFGGTRNASMNISPEMPVLIVLMCAMFLASNLLRTKPMIIHAAEAFALSCVLCALVGIVEYLLGMASLDWLDTEMFSDIDGRAAAFFENPNVLGTYLCLGAPLTLAVMSMSHDRGKSRWFIGFAFIIACSVLTWSRGAWVGIAVSVVMMLICTRHAFAVFMGSCLILPFAAYVIPQNVLERFLSIGNTADSSTMYRLNIWRGCADMAGEYGLAGIGVGEDAFARLYPEYAVAGAETAYHAHSLWLQILLMLGVCGLVLFAVMMLFFYRRALTVNKNSTDGDIRRIAAGSMSAVSGLLVAGLFDYTWYNYRVFFVYFVMMGLVCACDKVSAQMEGGSHGYE